MGQPIPSSLPLPESRRPDMTTAPPSTDEGKKPRSDSIARKWGKECRDAGWTAVPNILIQRQKSLGLEPIDLNILLHLMAYWWQDENKPHPSKNTLAQSIGVSPSTIRRRIKGMEAGGLIKRIERRRESDRSDTNEYDLTPLREALKPYAEEELTERRRAHAARRRRQTTVNKPKAK